MILTVTLNPALDLTYTIDKLVPYATHRVGAVAERPGGKGVNVARVLHAAGEPVLATGLLGGAVGVRVGRLLEVPAAFLEIAGETRRTVAVVDDSDATGLWEPGPTVTDAEWTRFVAHFSTLLPGVAVVVLSGSLPRGLPTDAYATLVRAARDGGVRTVLDASGPALRHGIAAGPDVLKPNSEELAALAAAVGGDPVAWALDLGAGAVVVSYGPHGLRAHTAGDRWHAVPPEVITGNPTGAGDACVAALARGLRDGKPWADVLTDAVALSAAAVAAPVAGAVDHDTYRRLLPRVTVTSHPQGAPHVPPHR